MNNYALVHQHEDLFSNSSQNHRQCYQKQVKKKIIELANRLIKIKNTLGFSVAYYPLYKISLENEVF